MNYYGELINSNGEKFDRKTRTYNFRDQLFAFREGYVYPQKIKLKQDYKNKKIISYQSKYSKSEFKKWKKTEYKAKKNQLKKNIRIEKNKIISSNNISKNINIKRINYVDLKNKIKNCKKSFKSSNSFWIRDFYYKLLEKKIKINNIYNSYFKNIKELTWENKYIFEISNVYKNIGNNILKERLKNINKFNLISKELKTKKSKDILSFNKRDYKNKIKELKLKNISKIKGVKQESKINNLTYKSFRAERKKIKFNYKKDLAIFKSTNPKIKYNQEISELKKKVAIQSKKNKIFLRGELNNVQKSIPTEISILKFWLLSIFGVILPGSTDIYMKRWFIGAFKISIMTFILSFILPWSFGAFPSAKGNGIIGLLNFGASHGHLLHNNDSRYYLVTGVLSLVFLFLSISIWVIMAIINLNSAKKIRLGIREIKFGKIINSKNTPYLLTMPAIIFLLFIIILPLVCSLFISFTNFNQRVNLGNGIYKITNGATIPFKWVGFDQFEYIFKIIGKDFSKVLIWTLIWTFGATILTLVVGTLLAVIVNQKRVKGKTFIRVIYLLPWAIPGFVTLLFFSVFFQKNSIFNETIGHVLFGRNIDWKNEVQYEKTILIFIQMWIGQSYIFILITGMIQSIPQDLYEASKIDGGSNSHNFLKITFPIVVTSIFPLLIGQFVGNFNNFNVIYLFNQGGPKLVGSSVGETDIFISWIYNLINGGGATSRPAAGAALSFIVATFVVTPSAIAFFRSKSYREAK